MRRFAGPKSSANRPVSRRFHSSVPMWAREPRAGSSGWGTPTSPAHGPQAPEPAGRTNPHVPRLTKGAQSKEATDAVILWPTPEPAAPLVFGSVSPGLPGFRGAVPGGRPSRAIAIRAGHEPEPAGDTRVRSA